MEMISELFLTSVKKRFFYYKDLAEKAMDQLEPGQLFFLPAEESNSIAMIVQHMSGNMLSRWTDFLTTDGEKEWRARDEEFEPIIETKEKLMEQWHRGWACLFNSLEQVSADNLCATIYIRNEPHSVLDAINRQLAHYPYHVGQIIYIAKMIKKGSWESLSMPKLKKDK